jgi:hypothetical protein
VNRHPGPPESRGSWQVHSLRSGPDDFSAAHNLSGQLI